METKADDFRAELRRLRETAAELGFTAIELTAGNLHRRVGGYPGENHRMPVCCDVMRQEMSDEDSVLEEPPKGKGASLKIRYQIRST